MYYPCMAVQNINCTSTQVKGVSKAGFEKEEGIVSIHGLPHTMFILYTIDIVRVSKLSNE